MSAPASGRQEMISWYRSMQLIRQCEEQLARCHQRGLIHGACHTYVGEEAIATGVRRSRRHLPCRAAGDIPELPDERDVIVIEERQHADRAGRRHDAVDPLVPVGEAHHILPDVDPWVPVHLPRRQLHDRRWLRSRIGLELGLELGFGLGRASRGRHRCI